MRERERERSFQRCQYAEWEGKETNGERSKKIAPYGGRGEQRKEGRGSVGGWGARHRWGEKEQSGGEDRKRGKKRERGGRMTRIIYVCVTLHNLCCYGTTLLFCHLKYQLYAKHKATEHEIRPS